MSKIHPAPEHALTRGVCGRLPGKTDTGKHPSQVPRTAQEFAFGTLQPEGTKTNISKESWEDPRSLYLSTLLA